MKYTDKNSNRYCPICGTLMNRKGHYSNGIIRLYCPKCKKSIRFGKESAKALREYHWLKCNQKIAKSKLTIPEQGLTYSTYYRHKINRELVLQKIYPHPDSITSISLDGTWINFRCYLIATCRSIIRTDYPLAFKIVYYEKFDTWIEFIRLLPKAEYYVCDGQKGLIKAIISLYPNAKIQICLWHVWQRIKTKLSLNPQTDAGKELLQIGRFLLIKIKDAKDYSAIEISELWIAWLDDWYKRYEAFIKQRTINGKTGKWFYTHKNVRSAYRTLKTYLDKGMLFAFINNKNIPRTNNGIEGGINSQIKMRLRQHLGANQLRQNEIVVNYLDSRIFKKEKH